MSIDPFDFDDELLDQLLDEEGVVADGEDDRPSPRGARLPEGERWPLSYAQQRMWFIHRLDPRSGGYNIAVALQLTGPLEPNALTAAVGDLVERHQVLRTRFVEDEHGITWAEPITDWPIGPTREDLRPLDEAARAARIEQQLAEAALTPFDLTTGPLLRWSLLQLEDEKWVVSLVVHHIATDGWSMGVVVRELGACYQARVAGLGPQLPPLPLQYQDFAWWQRGPAVERLLEEQLAWWRQQLDGIENLELPTDRRRPPRRDYCGAAVAVRLPGELVTTLRRRAADQQASLFMTLLASWGALMWRHSGQRDFAIGTPLANRHHPELEGLVGMFVNTLAIRLKLDPTAPFDHLLQQVRETALGAYAHQDLPFERLVAALGGDRDTARNPLVQVLFSLASDPPSAPSLGAVAIEELAEATVVAKFDLALQLEEQGDEVVGALVYACSLYDPSRMARLAASWERLVGASAAAEQRPLDELLAPSKEEWQALLRFGQPPCPALPADEDLVTRFERIAASHHSRVALSAGPVQLSYGELADRVARRAALLRAAGVDGGLVALAIPRSIELIETLLAVASCGAAYLPIDPSWPAARAALLLVDSGAGWLIGGDQRVDEWPLPASCRRLTPDLAAEAVAVAERSVDAERPLYVMYTSGSTGTPKGVVVPQRAVLRLVLDQSWFDYGPDHTLLHLATPSFDASTFEIWGALLHGGRVEVVEPGPLDLPRLAAVIRDSGASGTFLTTGLFNQIVDQQPELLAPMRRVITGGEALSLDHIRRCLARHPRLVLVNGYGPTENTTFTTCHPIAPDHPEDRTIPIGTPLAHGSVWLLDEARQPVPWGAPGEIWGSGAGLALGYLNQETLTAERFINLDLPGQGPVRAYRTGDLGRWNEQGQLEFLGRVDQQVKLRGYRIEPGEVEQALVALPGVAAAVVSVWQGGAGQRTLVAHIAAADGPPPSGQELREQLRQRLPDYLVPVRVVVLAELPLGSTGKVDRAALPDPFLDPDLAEEPQSPRSPVEEQLQALWQELLGLDRVALEASWFELGGDSIIAIQLANRLRQQGWLMELGDLFSHPSIAALAPRLVRDQVAHQAAPLPPAGPLTPTPVQAWYLGLPLVAAVRAHFNQSLLLIPPAPLEPQPVAAAVAQLLQRHDVLRLRLVGERGLEVVDPAAIESPFATLKMADEEELERELAALQQGFDLTRAPLWRVRLIDLQGEQRLALIAHHLLVDGVSWRVIIDELAALLAQPDQPLGQRPPPGSLRRWGEWLAAQPLEAEELAYWQGLAESLPPVDQSDRQWGDFAAAERVEGGLSAPLTRQLLTSAVQQWRAEIEELLLLALWSGWHQASGAEGVVITLEGHGRDLLPGRPGRPPSGEVVGWLTTLYPHWLRGSDDGWGTALARLRADLRRVPAGGGGYGRLLQQGEPERVAALERISPLLSFNYLGQLDAGGPQGWRFAPEGSGATVAEGFPRLHPFDLVLMVVEGELRWSLDGPRGGLGALATAEISRCFGEALERLLEAPPQPLPGPADFRCPGLGWEEYRALCAQWPAGSGEIEEVAPLAPLQQGLLFESLLAAEPGSYLVQLAWELEGPLDPAAFLAGWRWLAGRHRALRTAFVHEGLERPLQVVVAGREPELHYFDLTDGASNAIDPTYEPAAEGEPDPVARWREADLARGYDLAREPLMRLALWREGEGRHRVVWSYHHLLLDGWSAGVLQAELQEWLAAARRGAQPQLPAAPDWLDYLAWLQRQSLAAGLAYWREALAGAVAGRVPLPRDGGPGCGEGLHLVVLDGATTTALRQIATAAGATLSTLVHTLWGVVLMHYHQGNDLVFGSIVSGRPESLPGVEQMVGAMINAVPVRVCAPDPNLADGGFSDWVAQQQQSLLAAMPHHHLPLTELQVACGGDPLFDHLLIYENYPLDRVVGGEAGGDATVAVAGVEGHDRTHYDFTLVVVPGEELEFRLEYDPGRFATDWIEALGDTLRRLALRVVAEPTLAPLEIDLVSAELRARLAVADPDPEPEEWLKIHGESLLARPGVAAAALALAPLMQGGQAVDLWYEGDAPADQLREWLRGALPDRWRIGEIRREESLPVDQQGAWQGVWPPPVCARSTGGVQDAILAIARQVLRLPTLQPGDDLLRMGCHSLRAMQILSRLQRDLGVRITLAEFLADPRVGALAERVERTPAAGAERLALIPRAPERPDYPLSHAQHRLWLLHQLAGASAYNMPEAFEYRQALRVDLLEQALRRLIARHEALRTAFVQVAGEVRQRIIAEVPFRVVEEDLRQHAEPLALVQQRVEELARRPFDLTAPPLMRAHVLRHRDDAVVLLFVLHHIVGDGWSMNLLHREVVALYQALRDGAPDPLPPLRIQYRDYALWQARAGHDQARRYWLERLAGLRTTLDLPWDYRPDGAREFHGAVVRRLLDHGQAQALKEYARSRETTLSTLMLALFQLVLYRWSGQDQVCVGVSVAGRGHPDLEHLIGFFVNILPIHSVLDDELEFDELLQQVTSRVEEAFEHQDYPFDLLVRDLRPERISNRQPLVNVVYAFQNFLDVHIEGAEGGTGEVSDEAPDQGPDAFQFAFGSSKFDLTLFVAEEPEGLALIWEYDSDLFQAGTLEGCAESLLEFAGMVATAAATAGE